MSRSGAAVFPPRDLQSAGRGARQEFCPSRRRTDILPSGTRPSGDPREGSGALPGVRLEEEGGRSRSHAQIPTETPTGERRGRSSVNVEHRPVVTPSCVVVVSFNRLAKRGLSCWWPMLTRVTSATFREVKCWGKSPRNL